MSTSPGSASVQQTVGDSERAAKLAHAHEVAQSYAVLHGAIHKALALARRALPELEQDHLDDLAGELERIDEEVRSQYTEAWNWLSAYADDFSLKVPRATIRPLDLMETVAEILPAYSRRAQRRGIAMRLEKVGEEPIPPITVEEEGVRHALHNILGNALKYSYATVPAAHRFIRIWCNRHDAEHRTWAVNVQNYGVGILPEEIPLVTQPGYRGTLARKERIPGVGLGLAQVQRCMSSHSGFVKIRSEHLHDETFLTTITLVFARYKRSRD